MLNWTDVLAEIIIGKEISHSSYIFEYSLIGVLTVSGVDTYLLVVITIMSMYLRIC